MLGAARSYWKSRKSIWSKIQPIPGSLLRTSLSLCGLLAWANPSWAEVQPFYLHDQNPLIQAHGLPSISSTRLLEPEIDRFGFFIDVSNSFERQRRGNEFIEMDGELYRFLFHYQRGLSNGWNLRVDVPLLGYASGGTDASIEDFHDILGLPQNDRDQNPHDELSIRYSLNGEDLFSLDEAHQGLGDMSIALGFPDQQGSRYTSVWLQLKLPSGDPNKLTGSGALDASAWWQLESSLAKDWLQFAHLGISLLGDGDLLADRQRHAAVFGSWGLEWRGWADYATLQASLLGHTGLYDSDTDLLGEAIQFNYGAWWQLRQDLRFDLAMVEDIHTSSVPDVTLHLGLRAGF